jgi:hypothetical protein
MRADEEDVWRPGRRREQCERRRCAMPARVMADTAHRKHVTRGGDRVADIEEFRARRSRVIHKGVVGAGQRGELRVRLR